MINYIIIWIIIFIILIIILIIVIKLTLNDLKNIEKEIKNIFKERSSLIPCIFEISSNNIWKHKEVFYESLKLRRQEYINFREYKELNDFMFTEREIEHQIDFLFKIISKHELLEKKGNYKYIKWLIEDKTNLVYKYIFEYKKSVILLNKLIIIKNCTIIWFLIPIKKREVLI